MTQEEKEKMDAQEWDWIEREIQMDKDRELAETLMAISVIASRLAKKLSNKAELEWNKIWEHKCKNISSKPDCNLQKEV